MVMSVCPYARAQMSGADSLENLVKSSSLIVWGEVTQQIPFWHTDERGTHIYSTVQIKPVDWAIGPWSGEPVVLEVIGGTVDGITERVSDAPIFRVGADVIVFLKHDPPQLVLGSAGKMDVCYGDVYWQGKDYTARTFLEGLDRIAQGEDPAVLEHTSVRRLSLAAAGLPRITGISPSEASAGTGTSVTITGKNFGDIPGSSRVNFYYAEVPQILSWSDTQIVCTVPMSTSSGPVTVQTLGGTSNRYIFRVTFSYTGLKWPNVSSTVNYYINENADSCTGEGQAIQRAANTWSHARGPLLQYAGTHTKTSGSQNGKSEIMWGTSNSLALVYMWFSSGTLTECDLVFNKARDWSTSGTPGSSEFDVQTVSLHELGHWRGFNDLYGDIGDGIHDVAKVMFGYVFSGDTKQALHPTEREGMRWIYSGGSSHILYVDDDAAPGGNGGTWATAFQSIQKALDAAKSSHGLIDEIQVAAGIYRPEPTFKLLDGVTMRGGYQGLAAGDDPSIREVNTFTTILQGGRPIIATDTLESQGFYPIVDGSLTSATAVLDGFVLEQGGITGPHLASQYGTAITIRTGSTTIRHCTFRQNSALGSDRDGAALGYGGAVYIEDGSPRFEYCVFAENTADFGGALYAKNSEVLCMGCTFVDNLAQSGGAVAGEGLGILNLVNCIFSRNSALGTDMVTPWLLGKGGALACCQGGEAGIYNCTFTANSASHGGHAIACDDNASDASDDPGVLSIANSILWDHTEVLWMGSETRVDIRYSNISGGQAAIADPQGGLVWGPGNLQTDPLFFDVNDWHLNPASPCIDAGSNALLPPDVADLDQDADVDEPLPYDVAGLPRRMGSAVDMGASEYQP
ncbi:IPT/TIG domain-containing protein [Planctomycetota bacterium]